MMGSDKTSSLLHMSPLLLICTHLQLIFSNMLRNSIGHYVSLLVSWSVCRSITTYFFSLLTAPAQPACNKGSRVYGLVSPHLSSVILSHISGFYSPHGLFSSLALYSSLGLILNLHSNDQVHSQYCWVV